MPLNQLSANAIQSIVRRLLKLDIESQKQLSQFEGKRVQIKVDDLQLEYNFCFSNNELFVSESTQQPITASINGNLKDFLSALATEHSSDAIFKGQLNFTGDVNTAKQFQTFAQSLNIDWQEPLAQLFGDPVGHTIASGITKLSEWLIDTGKIVQTDISEYLQEESRVTPSESEQQHFFQQVDQLRSRADRLNARFNQLVSRSTKLVSDSEKLVPDSVK